jgi:hypothetical protein
MVFVHNKIGKTSLNNFVYICRGGDNEELRYSIRSVLHHYSNAKIWVVGEPPEWYTGEKIIVPQTSDKYTNAFKNLESICDTEEIPEKFYLMNDDFYIINKTKMGAVFNGGFFVEKYNTYKTRYPRSSYTKRLLETFKTMKRMGIYEPLDYELHVPMLMEKSKLQNVLPHRVLWRTLYGNMYSIGGTQMNDVKVYFSNSLGLPSYNPDIDMQKMTFLSTEDRAFPYVKEKVLSKLFPAPSKLEKPMSWRDLPRCNHCGNLI